MKIRRTFPTWRAGTLPGGSSGGGPGGTTTTLLPMVRWSQPNQAANSASVSPSADGSGPSHSAAPSSSRISITSRPVTCGSRTSREYWRNHAKNSAMVAPARRGPISAIHTRRARKRTIETRVSRCRGGTGARVALSAMVTSSAGFRCGPGDSRSSPAHRDGFLPAGVLLVGRAARSLLRSLRCRSRPSLPRLRS